MTECTGKCKRTLTKAWRKSNIQSCEKSVKEKTQKQTLGLYLKNIVYALDERSQDERVCMIPLDS